MILLSVWFLINSFYGAKPALLNFIYFVLLFPSFVLGDKAILKDAGINAPEDIAALPQPPELKGQQYKGDVSYFICTRPGRGPVVLSDETHLLNPETGLPK